MFYDDHDGEHEAPITFGPGGTRQQPTRGVRPIQDWRFAFNPPNRVPNRNPNLIAPNIQAPPPPPPAPPRLTRSQNPRLNVPAGPHRDWFFNVVQNDVIQQAERRRRQVIRSINDIMDTYEINVQSDPNIDYLTPAQLYQWAGVENEVVNMGELTIAQLRELRGRVSQLYQVSIAQIERERELERMQEERVDGGDVFQDEEPGVYDNVPEYDPERAERERRRRQHYQDMLRGEEGRQNQPGPYSVLPQYEFEMGENIRFIISVRYRYDMSNPRGVQVAGDGGLIIGNEEGAVTDPDARVSHMIEFQFEPTFIDDPGEDADINLHAILWTEFQRMGPGLLAAKMAEVCNIIRSYIDTRFNQNILPTRWTNSRILRAMFDVSMADGDIFYVCSEWKNIADFPDAVSQMFRDGTIMVPTGVRPMPTVYTAAIQYNRRDRVNQMEPANNGRAGSDIRGNGIMSFSVLCCNTLPYLLGNGAIYSSMEESVFVYQGVDHKAFEFTSSSDCVFYALAIAYTWATSSRSSSKLIQMLRPGKFFAEGMVIKSKIRQRGSRWDAEGSVLDLQRFVDTFNGSFKEITNEELAIMVFNKDYIPIHLCIPHSTVRPEEPFTIQPLLEDGHWVSMFERTNLMMLMYDETRRHYLPILPKSYCEVTKAHRNTVLHERVSSEVIEIKNYLIEQKRTKSKPKALSGPVSKCETSKEFANLKPQQCVKPHSHHGGYLNTKVFYLDMETEQTKCDTKCEPSQNGWEEYLQTPIMLGLYSLRGRDDKGVVYPRYDYRGMLQIRDENYRVFLGYDVPQLFWRYIAHELPTEELHESIWLAHNGLRFDFILLIGALHSREFAGLFRIMSMVPKNSGFLYIQIQRIGDKSEFCLCDTIYHLSGSLDKITRDLDTTYKKQTGTVDYDQLTVERLRNDDEFRNMWMKYLEYDVKSLAQAYEMYALTCFNFSNVDIRGYKKKVLTAASMSRDIFKRMFLDPKAYPLMSMNALEEVFVRASFHGGRTEAVASTNLKCIDGVMTRVPLYMYDIVSQYPKAMTHDLPYGRPTWLFNISFDRIKSEDIKGFCQVTIRSTGDSESPDNIPFLGIHHTSGTFLFPHISSWHTVIITITELRFIIDNGLDYEFKEQECEVVLSFQYGPVLAELTTTLFKLKNDATTPTERMAAKIALNSAYGSFAQRREGNMVDVFVLNNENIMEVNTRILNGYYSNFKVRNGVFFGSHTGLIQSSTIIPSLASEITALARIQLYTIISGIMKEGGTCYYWDTDSVITDLKLEANENLKHLIGKGLGQLSNDLSKWGDDTSIHEFYAIGPKMYACRGVKMNGDIAEDVYKVASKGFQQINFLTIKNIHRKLEEDGVSDDSPSNEELHSELQMRFSFKKSHFFAPEMCNTVRPADTDDNMNALIEMLDNGGPIETDEPEIELQPSEDGLKIKRLNTKRRFTTLNYRNTQQKRELDINRGVQNRKRSTPVSVEGIERNIYQDISDLIQQNIDPREDGSELVNRPEQVIDLGD